MDEKFNGWSNYSTWNMNLKLTTNESHFDIIDKQANALLANIIECQARDLLADFIEVYVMGQILTTDNELVTLKPKINFKEIADEWIDNLLHESRDPCPI